MRIFGLSRRYYQVASGARIRVPAAYLHMERAARGAESDDVKSVGTSPDLRGFDTYELSAADYLIPFRKIGVNPVPVSHPEGLMTYAGERKVPSNIMRYRGWVGKQTENRYSHWIWRQYASCFWDDIRLSNVLPYVESREEKDERHVHPLQLDVIDRACVLWSNAGETVLSPFMGVGSEVYGAVRNGRKGIGIELKPAYYRQALANLESLANLKDEEQTLFDVGDYDVRRHAEWGGLCGPAVEVTDGQDDEFKEDPCTTSSQES